MRNKPKTFCKTCDSDKMLEEMVSNKRYGIGYKFLCKKCDALISKSRRKENKAKIKQIKRNSYLRNRDEILLKKSIYYQLHKEEKSQYNKSYALANKETLSVKQREREVSRLRKDPAFKFKKNVSSLIRKSLKNKGFKKSSDTWVILGIDKTGLIEYFIKTQNIDIRDTQSVKNLEIDHICPISQARNQQEILKLNNFSNLRFLSRKENIIKSDNKTLDGEIKCRELLGREWVEKC